MLLSSTTAIINSAIGDREAIALLKNAGFDAYDFSFLRIRKNPSHPMNKESYLDFAKEIRAFADSLGIVCNQAHAPYPTSSRDPLKTDEYRREILRSMEAASVMGAKSIVIHPQKHLSYAENKEELFRINTAFFQSLIPYAEKWKIKICAENMWERDEKGKIIPSACAAPDEFCALIDAVASPWLCACLDIGHAALVSEDIPNFIEKLGTRLFALHIHDNDLLDDSHMLPFLMKIDFDSFAKALSDFSYQGDFTFEVPFFFKKMPPALYPAAARLLHDTGRYLMEKIRS